MAGLQREQYATTAGWGSWYPHNLLAVTRLPDGAQLQFGLCQVSTGACEVTTVDSSQSVRLGPHATDGSFAQLWHWYPGSHWDGGVNVSITWGTTPSSTVAAAAGGLADLRLVVGSASCGNCTNYVILLLPSFENKWGKTGAVSVAQRGDGAASFTLTPDGVAPTTLNVTGPPLSAGQRASITGSVGPHAAFAVVAGKASAVVLSSHTETATETSVALATAEVAERARYASYGTPALAELKEAVQASTMWLTVYVPYATGLILTLSRGSMGGGNSQCDWDNFFAAMMLGSDEAGQGLGFATFAQEIGSKTVDGFVPNGANAAKKSRDRTEPIVGAKVLRSFLTRFGIEQTAWLIEWSFDKLFGWHDWAWRRRQLAPLGLIAPGSDPLVIDDPSDWGANTMQGARWETGMDNSPMYDGPDGSSDNKSGVVIFNTSQHLMQLYDVGMTANLASDMLALADAGDAWCSATNATAALAHSTPCGVDTKTKITTLRKRAATLAGLTQAHLWNEEVSAFTNKLPRVAYNLDKDTFYARISPTSFYPLMTGAPTTTQADRMVQKHLLNPTSFCVTSESEWPPTPVSFGLHDDYSCFLLVQALYFVDRAEGGNMA